MILPAAVLTGLAVGGSCAIGVYFELPDENKYVQGMYKDKHRAALWSTVVSLTVGYFCGPVAGVISEMINYPVALLKVRRVDNYLNKKYKLENKTLENSRSVTYSNSNIEAIFA